MKSADQVPENGYGSIEDLPSVKEIRQRLLAFSLFKGLLPKAQRQELKDLRRQMESLIALVERFYALLGPRHWVWHDNLNTKAMEAVLAGDPTPEEAEARLIAYYQDPEALKWLVMFLNRVAPMRCRLDLLDKVKTDYSAGRYHAVVPVLIAQMDGMVNDVNPAQRQGLHAKEPGEMIAWDSVTAHHQGLSHALVPFQKGFQATRIDPVFEVHRHGIMHGNLIGYDNEVVATKAWNLLFAVADWAYAELNPPKPPEPEPSWKELMGQVAEHGRRKKQSDQFLDQWEPWESGIDPCDDRGAEVIAATKRLLEAWQQKRWHLVGKEFGLLGPPPSDNQLAGQAKELYRELELTGFELLHVKANAPAVQLVDVNLEVNGQIKEVQLRWLLVDPNILQVGLPGQGGVWKLCPYGPSPDLMNKGDDR